MQKYRILPYMNDSGAMQMAIDEAITIACSERKSPPTLRFYSFNPSAITLGYGQRINILDFKKIEEKGFDYVRRITGGTGVLHKNDLVYSLILPEDSLPHKVLDAYNYLSDGLVIGLKRIGLKAEKKDYESKKRKDSCYLNSNPYDVMVNGMKISGNAQARLKGVVLQHGTIIIEDNLNELIECLNLRKDEKQNLSKSAKNKVTCIKNELRKEVTLSKLEEAMLLGFVELFNKRGINFKKGYLTDYEKHLAEKLCKEKYSTKEWNHLR